MITSLLVALAAMQPAPFDAARWTLADPGIATLSYLGRPSLFIDNGMALLKDSAFGDGTIEVDIAMQSHPSFAGIVFRASSKDDYELVYLRPHLSRQPDTIQYTPVFQGSAAWQLYNGQGYTASAELPADRWVHLKLVVSGYEARLYVDGAAAPQLTMTELKHPWTRGQVGLWGRFSGASFSNFAVSPAGTTAPPRPPDADGTASGATGDGRDLLTTWELSQSFDTSKVPPDAIPDRASLTWTRVTAERTGLVNIARDRASVRTAASAKDSRDLVFARSIVTSSRAQRMRLVVAYSDALHLFVNGRLLFAGEGAFASRDPTFLGIATLGPDAVYIDLRPGDNEIVFAVSESFGGWGFAARLEPLGPAYEPEGNTATPQFPTPQVTLNDATPKTPKSRRSWALRSCGVDVTSSPWTASCAT